MAGQRRRRGTTRIDAGRGRTQNLTAWAEHRQPAAHLLGYIHGVLAALRAVARRASTQSPALSAGLRDGFSMPLLDLLRERRDDIVGDAFDAMERSALRSYRQSGADATRQRLGDLYDLTVRAIADRQLGAMIAHAEKVAAERYAAGYDLWEVQTAFNVLEEAIWLRIIKELPTVDFAEGLGLVGTVLGAGKDALARAYVSLASKSRAPTLNLQSLFTGGAGA